MSTSSSDVEKDLARIRRRVVYPAECCKTGTIVKWINAVTIVAKGKKCDDMIPNVSADDMKYKVITAPEGEAQREAFLKKQHKLAEIINEWTDPDTDWDEFTTLDPTSDTIGTDMWMTVMILYNGTGPKAIQQLRKMFNDPQADDENVLQYWQRIKKATLGLGQMDRKPSSTDIIDAFKGGVSGDHRMWVADVSHDTSPLSLELMIREKGDFIDNCNKPAVEKKVAFPAKAQEAKEKNNINDNDITEQITAAIAAAFKQQQQQQTDRYRNNRRRETRKCFHCQKVGHIAKNCYDNPDNKNKDGQRKTGTNATEDPHAFPAFAFPAHTPVPTSENLYSVLMDLSDDDTIDNNAESGTMENYEENPMTPDNPSNHHVFCAADLHAAPMYPAHAPVTADPRVHNMLLQLGGRDIFEEVIMNPELDQSTTLPTPAIGITDLPVDVCLTPYVDNEVWLIPPPTASGPRGYAWDWIRGEFVDITAYPQILEDQIDFIFGFVYNSVHMQPNPPPTRADAYSDNDGNGDDYQQGESCQPERDPQRQANDEIIIDADVALAERMMHPFAPFQSCDAPEEIHHAPDDHCVSPTPSKESSPHTAELIDDHQMTPSAPTKQKAVWKGGRRARSKPSRATLTIAGQVLKTHGAQRNQGSRTHSQSALYEAADIIYTYELTKTAAKTLFNDFDTKPTAAAAQMTTNNNAGRDCKAWIVDSGANRHISAVASDFVDLKLGEGGTISGISVPIKGSGTIRVTLVDTDGFKRVLTMHDVLYAPDLSIRSNNAYHRLFSVRQANSMGCSISFRPDNDLLVSSNGHDYALLRSDGLTWLPVYDIDAASSSTDTTGKPHWEMGNGSSARPKSVATASLARAVTSQVLHRRCCHLNEADIQKLIKLGVLGKPRLIGDTFCKSCAVAKSRIADINREPTRDHDHPDVFHTVSMDIWGPMNVEAIGGYRFAIGMTDHTSGGRLVDLVKQKSEAPQVLTAFLRRIRSLGHKVKILRIDNDSVFLSEAFQNICDANDIEVQRTAPYAHHQLGRQERQWRTLAEAAKAMLLDAGLDKRFWGLAFLTAVHVRNRVWNSGSQCIPMEVITGTRPSLDHLRVFGCPAFVHIDSAQRRKLDDKAWEGIMVGYASDSPAWLIYNPRTRRIERSRSVVFCETAGGEVENTMLSDDSDDDAEDIPPSSRGEARTENPPSARGESSQRKDHRSHNDMSIDDRVLTRSAAAQHEQARITKTYADAIRQAVDAGGDNLLNLFKMKEKYGDDLHIHLNNINESQEQPTGLAALVPEPSSFRKAMNSDAKQEWAAAINKEYNSQMERKTWSLVPLPHGRRAIGCLWRFKVKRDAEGNIIKYKARLCARGDHQQEGVDYNETFSPTVRYQTLRTLLALACYYDLEVEQFDAVCAFLNANVEEEIYMDQPEGFETYSATGGRLVCRLNKALYGLVQAPRCWNQKVTAWLHEYGFEQSKVDPGIYTMYHQERIYILALYVDDAICIGRDIAFILKLKEDFAAAFDIEDLGPVSWLLGCSIKRNRNAKTITISQKQYLLDILDTFGMSDCKPVATPMSAKPTVDNSLDEPLDIKQHKYAELVGKLNYLANCTRPDIAAAVSHLSRYMSHPTKRHWEQGKRVLRYLKGTVDYAITYSGDYTPLPTTWQDASYGDGPDRRSRTGFVTNMCGAAVLWGSKLQHSVALSTVEAEYMALAAAAQEVLFIRQLLKSFGMTINNASPMYEDNRGCLSIATNAMTTGKTKHIDIRYHFVRDLVNDNTISLTWCPTEDMIADILTKFSLPAARHKKLSTLMMNLKMILKMD